MDTTYATTKTHTVTYSSNGRGAIQSYSRIQYEDKPVHTNWFIVIPALLIILALLGGMVWMVYTGLMLGM